MPWRAISYALHYNAHCILILPAFMPFIPFMYLRRCWLLDSSRVMYLFPPHWINKIYLFIWYT